MSPCNGLDGCFHTGEVAIGYFPYIVALDQITIRVAPHDGAAPVLLMRQGQRFGVQSTRNPSESAHPAPRPGRNGFVWGYANQVGASGWIKQRALVPDDSGDVWADGPASADFQVGAQEPKHNRTHSSCKGRASNTIRRIDVEDTYLRYAPQSTPFYYLVKNDTVRERWRSFGKYMCVRVMKSDTCPAGTCGWIPYASVK